MWIHLVRQHRLVYFLNILGVDDLELQRCAHLQFKIEVHAWRREVHSLALFISLELNDLLSPVVLLLCLSRLLMHGNE